MIRPHGPRRQLQLAKTTYGAREATLLRSKLAKVDHDVAMRIVRNMVDDPATVRRLEQQRKEQARAERELRQRQDTERLAEWQLVARRAEQQRAEISVERCYFSDAMFR